MEISNKVNAIEQTQKSFDISAIKKENNKNIIEAQLQVSLKDGPSVLSLLFRTAIEEINNQLSMSPTENAIEKTYENNIDVTPEATADRILKGTTSFFNAYKEQNKDLSESEALTKFVDVIKGGIDIGFEDARNILNNLSVLEGDIANEVNLTYNFVLEGLNTFTKKITATFQDNEDINTSKSL